MSTVDPPEHGSSAVPVVALLVLETLVHSVGGPGRIPSLGSPEALRSLSLLMNPGKGDQLLEIGALASRAPGSGFTPHEELELVATVLAGILVDGHVRVSLFVLTEGARSLSTPPLALRGRRLRGRLSDNSAP